MYLLTSTAMAAAFFTALAAPLLIKPLLSRRGVIDMPSERSSHDSPVLRGGGLAQAFGIITGMTIAWSGAFPGDRATLGLLLVAAVAFAAVGLAEDIYGLSVGVRLALQTSIGASSAAAFISIEGKPELWTLVAAILVAPVLVNTVNFMDGIDGMSALHGFVMGSGFAIVGGIFDQDWMFVSGGVMATAYLAFLPWNAGGKLFLGDVGSYLLGGFAAVIVSAGIIAGVPLFALVGSSLIYLVDVSLTLVARIISGQPWHESHRDHIYQRLSARRFRHLTVSAFVAGLSLVTTVFAVAASRTEGATRFALILFCGLIMVLYAALRPATSGSSFGREISET